INEAHALRAMSENSTEEIAAKRKRFEAGRADPRRGNLQLAADLYTTAFLAPGVTLDFSRPGKPTDNAFIESFNGKFRAECLNAHWFMSLDDARRKCEAWRRDYNEERISQRDRQQSPDRADRSVSGTRPALTEAGWKKPSSLVQGWGAVQM